MQRIITILLTIFLALIFMFGGCTGKKQEKTLVVAMELQFPPFEMSDGQGNPSGISVDMAYALGKYLGKKVKIENTSWTGLIPSLQTEKADLVISSMSITAERDKVVDFSEPYARSGLTLLLNKNTTVTDWADIDREGITIAVKSGTIGAILAKEQIKTATVRYFDEVAACVLEVSQGKADAFIYDALTVFESYKKHTATTKVNLANIPGTAGPWGIALKEGNDALRIKVNDFIKEFRAKGEFEKLEKKHLGEMKDAFDAAGVPSFFVIE